MPKQRHDQHHAAAATTNTSLLPAADCRCSSQQAAAAWAWFEHGGSTCITPPKSQGLMAAKRPPHANSNSAGPSRFKQELLITPMKIPQADATTEGHPQRRHSFHSHDLSALPTSFMYQNLSSSCRSPPNLPRFNIGVGAHLNEANHEEGGNISCQDEASSLLDKFEVEAVCRQLHDHLITGPRTGLNSTCSAERQAHHEAQNAHHDHLQAHHKPRYCKSSHAAHKPLADNEHHHININDVVHRLLHLRIKMSSRSTSSAGRPTLMCSSISTANSIFDHHHHPAASPNQLRKATSKLQDTRSNMQNTGRVSNYSGELAAADEHESRGEFTSRHRKSQQKMRCRDHELIGGASPSRLHEADLIYSKALQPLVSRLPHMSALLGHKVHGDHPSRGDGVARSKQNSQCHEHHHIHHHHHHYHDLQHIDYALQDGLLLQDHLITNKVGADLLHRPKLYSLNHKEELMIPSHAGGRSQYNIAAQNPPSLNYKLGQS